MQLSCMHTVQHWLEVLESGHELCVVFLDLHKASDSVPHQPLEKLATTGLDYRVLTWICSNLTECQQSVIVDGESSNSIPVLSGVPQGSVLGPLLFLVYINGVLDIELTTGSSLNLFADDILLHKIVCSDVDFVESTERSG